MLDFFTVRTEVVSKKGETIYKVEPEFIVDPDTKDLMIRGGDFYAVWDEHIGLWSTNEKSVIRQVDAETKKVADELEASGHTVNPLYLRYSRSGMIDKWHKYCWQQMRDVYSELDLKVTFSNSKVTKNDFVSKRLPYPLEKGSIDAYDELIGTLYSPEEREKLEWAIGAIITGDSRHIQKFEVLYGSAGTGKSTILNIIQWLFDGYYSVFNAKELTSANNAFALESFKSNPLVSIQHDGDLSRIEDNTKLNSVVSHETMEINEKHKNLYKAKFSTFLFMGTNKPVKITDAKSGILRRLIDVKPTGKKVPYHKYHELMGQIQFELGAIAHHCLDIYTELGENYYDSYIPTEMMSVTNDFYDFIEYHYDMFAKEDVVTLTKVWNLYVEYCEFANTFKLSMKFVKNELKNYFETYEESGTLNGRHLRNIYSGFRRDKFDVKFNGKEVKKENAKNSWLIFSEIPSLFDKLAADWLAQYPKEDGSPEKSWKYVKSKLKSINTKKLHWVKPPEEVKLVCIDFDIRGSDGNKSLDLNAKAASKWPKTYAELSKSGGGIHLYYFYDGDVSKLSRIFEEGVEIKVFTGGSSLRRMLTKCNDIPIATINTGLPLKGEVKEMVNWDGIKNEKMLRTMIIRNLAKEYHADTTSSVDYIKYLLDQAYESGITYDVSDMMQDVLIFASNSTNQSERCVNTVGLMKFKSDEAKERPVMESVSEERECRLVFFDCEVYSNFFCIVWKYADSDTCVHMIDPEPDEVAELFHFKLVGFNCRNYDNHILYARTLGYSDERLYELSTGLISGAVKPFKNAYDISYTDVYDFSTTKMGLKKWEIKLDIHHQEMGIPWDQPVPEDMKMQVVEYCENDVRATEAVFNARKGDFIARKIQVDLVKLLHGDGIKVSVNDTTNTLSKRIIFGSNRNPQNEFNYRNMALPVGSDQYDEYRVKFGDDYVFRVFNAEGLPEYRDYIPGEVLPDGWSILPFFPGYEFGWSKRSPYYDEEVTAKVGLGKSLYLGEVIGEGGRVYSEQGFYCWVWDGDVSSQHPSSTDAEMLFGPKYTPIYTDIRRARVAIKHKDFELAGSMLNGALKKYLNSETAGDLAQALKIVLNSVYGLTSAKFKNEFRDDRNEDNIVAKRGALFMTLLKREVQKKGFQVCHIKTDSIKIPMATKDIQDFVVKFGKEYGYEFETEGVFIKFCLLNDAAYIAKEDNGNWLTKAAQFSEDKNPYVYKTLFTKEPILFKDMCETMSVTKGALYLDMNEELPDVSEAEKNLDKILAKIKKDSIEISQEVQEGIDILRETIATGHDYRFVGRVGLFCPVVAGAGGGVLYRMENDKAYAVGGTTGYRFLEAEHVLKYGMEDKIDRSFYISKVDEAIADINAIGDDIYNFEWLVSDDTVPQKPIELDFMNIPEDVEGEELPWDE